MSWGGVWNQHIFRRPKTHPLSAHINVQETSTPNTAPGVRVPARITLFGFDPVQASARIEARTVRWRLNRTLTTVGVALLLAPLVALVPPHAPWALGSVGIGMILGRRKWLERYSLHALDGSCPSCGSPVSIPGTTRLRLPHPLPCDSCSHELSVEVDRAPLEDLNS